MKLYISQPSNEILQSLTVNGRSRFVIKRQYFHSLSKVTMVYSFVYLLFLSAFILVQCGEFQHEEKGPHEFQDISDCRAVKNQIRENRMKAVLKPRERLVTLIPKDGYVYNPHTVTVNRCNGFCPSRWSPMPTKTQMKKFIVHLHEEGNPTMKNCVAVGVIDHMLCKCMCMQSEKICKPSQDWNSESCNCQCKDRERLKRECTRQYGMEWYEDNCYCACTQKIMECQSGQKWAKEVCGCVQE